MKTKINTPILKLSAILVVLAVLLSSVNLTASAAATTLGAAAAQSGRYFGAAISAGKLGDSTYTTIANREFNMVTAENEMKMDATEPNQNQFNFTNADRIFNWAVQNGKQVRGHTLAWHSQQPALDAEHERHRPAQRHDQPHQRGDGPLQGQDLRLGRGERGVRRRTAAGATPTSSAPATTGSRWRSGPPAPPTRPPSSATTTTTSRAGATPRPRASTTWSRTSRPAACRSTASASRRTSTAAPPTPSNFRTTLSSFAALGVDVQITELDIENARLAADWCAEHRQRLPGRLALHRHHGLGRPRQRLLALRQNPLLFDGNGNKKAAYTAVLNALNAGSAHATADHASTVRSQWHRLDQCGRLGDRQLPGRPVLLRRQHLQQQQHRRRLADHQQPASGRALQQRAIRGDELHDPGLHRGELVDGDAVLR